MRRVSLLPAAMAVFGLVALGGLARATSVLPLALEDLVERSDVVAHVRIVSVRVEQTPEAPFRLTEIEIVESFRGAQPGETFEIRQRGDGRIFVIGDPWLEPGQEGLAFLRQVEGQTFLTALAQSWWRFEGQGDEIVAQRDMSGLELIRLGETVLTPPNRARWSQLRRMLIQACEEVR